jgi:hypothetical protein
MNIDRTAQWYIKCLTCHYARWFGVARFQAGEAASKHQRLHSLHRVQIWMLAEDRNPEDSLETLPSGVDVIPF